MFLQSSPDEGAEEDEEDRLHPEGEEAMHVGKLHDGWFLSTPE